MTYVIELDMVESIISYLDIGVLNVILVSKQISMQGVFSFSLLLTNDKQMLIIILWALKLCIVI